MATIDPPAAKEPVPRLQSLDALRGFTMFWIIGGDRLAGLLAAAAPYEWLDWFGKQMSHVAWNGFHIEDAIFPTFLFVSGAALPFSVLRRVEEGRSSRMRELLVGARRAVTLVMLGMVVNGVLGGEWGKHMQNVRFGSVLGRIGLAWYFALVISLFTGWRGRTFALVVMLAGYWAAMTYIPVPGHDTGDLRQGNNLCDYIDQTLMPGRLYWGNHDPEGLFSTIPAIGTALLGVLAGGLLRVRAQRPFLNALILIVCGAAAIGAALAWDKAFPINKNLWTSSFALMAGGLSLCLLGLFHGLVEGCRLRPLVFPFIVIGANAIAIYLAAEGVRDKGVVDFRYTAKYLFNGLINGCISDSAAVWRPVALTVATILIEWLCLWFLWRKKTFFRV